MTSEISNSAADSPASTSSESDATEEAQPDATSEVSADATAQLRADLAGLKTERDKWHDQFLRKAAEFENYRKRAEKEKLEFVRNAKSSVLLEFLHVLDTFERALGSFTEGPDAGENLNQYKEGIELLYKQLNDTLVRLGVVPIEAKGEKFDPHLHEALSSEETDKYEEHTVIEELRRGYLYRDRLLRPPQVKVASSPSDESEETLLE